MFSVASQQLAMFTWHIFELLYSTESLIILYPFQDAASHTLTAFTRGSQPHALHWCVRYGLHTFFNIASLPIMKK
jgi:hypothetical protein